MARQRYVEQVGELDPVDLKTLAQFNLLGDPSLHPAQVPTATEVPKGIAADDAQRAQRRLRRAKLRSAGDYLRANTPATARPQADAACSATVKKALALIAQSAGLPSGEVFVVFAVDAVTARAAAARTPTASGALRSKAGASTVRYHIALANPAHGPAKPARATSATFAAVAAVAREVDGRIVGYRIYVQR